MERKQYSDYELLSLLEENGYAVTYTNLCILKESLAKGEITLDDEDPEKKEYDEHVKKVNDKLMGRAISEAAEEEVPAEETEEPVEGEEVPQEVGQQPAASVVMTPDGAVSAENALGVSVAVDPTKTVQISVMEAAPAEEVPAEGEIPVEQQPVEGEGEAVQPRISIEMPVDGSMAISDYNKQVVVDAQGNLQANICENTKYKNFIPYREFNKENHLLESFLIEDCGFSSKEYSLLSEDVKVDSLKEILSSLLKSLEEKLVSIDTSIADRSRGDVKQLKELPEIQNAVTKLEAMLERDENTTPVYAKAVEIVIRALLNVNKYSAEFKEAYRNKKTVLIMKYQALILSIVSSISYLLSVLVDYRGGNMTVVSGAEINLDIGPLKALNDFNKSVESGEFKRSITDVTTVREFFLEVPTDKMSTILEATDYIPMIIDGVKSIYNNLDNNGKLVNLIYKAVGVVVLILSLRDAFYTFINMKTKLSDMLGNIKLFANSGENGGVLSKLSQFAYKFKNDAEFSDKLAKNEIESENRQVVNQVRDVKTQSMSLASSEEKSNDRAALGSQQPVTPSVPSISDFSLDF